MTTTTRLTTVLLLLVAPLFSFAQKKYWEGNISVGAIQYYGDLTPPSITLKEAHLATQISFRKYFDGQHALRLNLLYGKISGDDSKFERNGARGNSFEARLTEFSVMGELDLMGRKRFSKKTGFQKRTSPYLLLGVAVAYADPDVHYGQPNSKDADIDYFNLHFSMPVGGGLKYDLSKQATIGLELCARITISDYLDGTQASGNAYKNDMYVFGGLTLGYRFLKKGTPDVEKQKSYTVL